MLFPEQDQRFQFPGPVGELTVSVEMPRGAQKKGIAIICHPHPLYQGTMNNKVVTTLTRAYKELGCVAIRFNFRGVEKSEGEYGHGKGEAADLQAIIKWVRVQQPAMPLFLAGFSFGAFVAAQLAAQDFVQHLVTVGPAVENFDFATLPTIACPWWVLQGAADEVVNAEAVYAFVEKRVEAPVLLKFEDCGHFFHGRLVELRERVMEVIAPSILEGTLS